VHSQALSRAKNYVEKGLSAGATTRASHRGAKPHFPSGMPVDSGLCSLPLAATPKYVL